jgi:hypothetical protein
MAASADKISKNAFFATAVLEVALTREIAMLGYPANVRHLVASLDIAITENFPAMGAFRKEDWLDIRRIIATLADVGILSDVRAKSDPKDPDLIVFALTLSKLGRSVWPRISERIREVLDKNIPKEEALPLIDKAVRS